MELIVTGSPDPAAVEDRLVRIGRVLVAGHGDTYPNGQPRPPWDAVGLVAGINTGPGVVGGSSQGGYVYGVDGSAESGIPSAKEDRATIRAEVEGLHTDTGRSWTTLVVLVDRAETRLHAAFLAGAEAEAFAYTPASITTLGPELLEAFGDPRRFG